MHKTSRTWMLEATLAVVACLMLTSGCAKIGEPQPPEVLIPKAAVDLAAHQLADTIILKVASPVQNTDGSATTTLASVDIYRLEEERSTVAVATPPPLPAEEFGERATRILTIPSSALEDYIQGESLIVPDKLDMPDRSLIYSRRYRYAVLFVNNKNQAAGFSNQATLAPVAVPLPPAGLKAIVAEESIKLSWVAPSENMDGSTPPRIAGYKIYRAEGSGDLSSAPIHADLAQGTVFEDRDFQFDKSYRYAIRTVGSGQNPYAESRSSEMLAVETRDVFPPAPPENFHAIPQEGSIILLWAASSSADAAGYRIYREDKTSGVRVPLQKELITVLNYRDSQPEGKYSYVIQTVDAHGNESAPVQAEIETH